MEKAAKLNGTFFSVRSWPRFFRSSPETRRSGQAPAHFSLPKKHQYAFLVFSVEYNFLLYFSSAHKIEGALTFSFMSVSLVALAFLVLKIVFLFYSLIFGFKIRNFVD